MDPVSLDGEPHTLFVDENIESIADDIYRAYREDESYSSRVWSNLPDYRIKESTAEYLEDVIRDDLSPDYEPRWKYITTPMIMASGAFLMTAPDFWTRILGSGLFSVGIAKGSTTVFDDVEEWMGSDNPELEAKELAWDIATDIEVEGDPQQGYILEYDPIEPVF